MFRKFTLLLSALGLLLSLAGAYNITSHVVDGVPEYLNITNPPFVQIGDGYYYIAKEQGGSRWNWFQAYIACREIGAELVSFETREEMDAIDTYMGPLNTMIAFFWTSGTDLAVQGEHVWFSNGKPLPSSVWGRGEPNNQGGDERCDCLTRTTNGPRIDDAPCQRKCGYICEAPRPKTASFVIW